MTEKEKIHQINDFLKEYNDCINNHNVLGVDNANQVILDNCRRTSHSIMLLEEIEYKNNVQEALESVFGKPILNEDFYHYLYAIPYDYKYLYNNPSDWKVNFLNYYPSCGIEKIKDSEGCDIVAVTHFDDFNGLFAPAFEQFKFNQTRKEQFLTLLAELNQIKSEEPKLYMILNHQCCLVEGYFLMLLEYSNNLYLFKATDNA